MTGLNSVRKYEEKVWDRKHSKGRVMTGLNSVRKYEEKVCLNRLGRRESLDQKTQQTAKAESENTAKAEL